MSPLTLRPKVNLVLAFQTVNSMLQQSIRKDIVSVETGQPQYNQTDVLIRGKQETRNTCNVRSQLAPKPKGNGEVSKRIWKPTKTERLS